MVLRNLAATEIQRHVRGFTTRRRLSVDTRLGVVRILATPTKAGISCPVGIYTYSTESRHKHKSYLHKYEETNHDLTMTRLSIAHQPKTQIKLNLNTNYLKFNQF